MSIKDPSKEKENAALFSIVAAVGLTTGKLFVGLLTGSLGILSDAAHSGVDLVASGITYLAVRISKKPPDSQHPYGHGKIENVSALVEFIILFLIGVWIIYEAVGRIFNNDYNMNISVWTFGVMICAIGVDYSRYRVLKKTAEKYKSSALEADAVHFLSDMITTLAVITGLVFVKAGVFIGDSIASIFVAFYIIRISFKLGKDTVHSLMDSAPKKDFEKVNNVLSASSEILGYNDLRIRSVGEKTFIDVNVQIDRNRTFEKSHNIVDNLEENIAREIDHADIVIHAEPVEREEEDIQDKIKGIISKYEGSVHDLLIIDTEGKLNIDLDMEFDHNTSLKNAFNFTRKIKDEIFTNIKNVEEVNVHIEDKNEEILSTVEVSEEYAELIVQIHEILEKFPDIKGYHNLKIYKFENSLKCNLHCEFEENLTVQEVHKIIGVVEKNIKENIEEINYIVIQPEPKT
ncbi:cation diffusion facilitator family transporter [candidate division KSB1 bacterium]